MAKSECHRYGYGRLVCTFGDADTPMFGITFGGWVCLFLSFDPRLGYRKVATEGLKYKWGGGWGHILHLACFTVIWSLPEEVP